MNLLKDLELIDVRFENENNKAVVVFLDEQAGEIREVNFNKQSYENGKFINDPEKAKRIEEMVKQHFNLDFDKLAQAIGVKKDVYVYDNFNSLTEVDIVHKFDDDMVGQLIEVTVSDVIDDDIAVRIRFQLDGKTYESKMSYADYVESRKEWFTNPQKRDRQYEKFENKFGINIAEKEKLVGMKVMIEIKKAMGKWVYVEVKPLPKKK